MDEGLVSGLERPESLRSESVAGLRRVHISPHTTEVSKPEDSGHNQCPDMSHVEGPKL